jgi:putative transposase
VVHWIYKIWTNDNHAVDLTDTDIMEKIDNVHNNPIRAGLVDSPLHYI